MSTNPLIARFVAGDALVAPERLEVFEGCVRAVAEHPRIAEMMEVAASADDGFWPEADSWMARYRPYVIENGILQIPVKGVLLNDFPFALGSWATGYAYIQRAFERGVADYKAGNIKGIALIHDTPGGMVAGCFDCVDKMHAAKLESGVPVRAFAHEHAYSAGYATFSVGDHGAVSRTGGVGSIGVVTMHLDMSKALGDRGIKITFIHAGKHKVDGNAYEALPDDVKARIQSRIDAIYEVFVATVARNRGMDEQAVRDTEALTFTASEAVSNGLADSIGSLDDAVAAFAAELSPNEGDEQMSTQDTTAVDQAAALNAEYQRGVTEGKAAGATAERARINAILGSDEGKARPKAALSAALKTDMTVDQAKAFLGDLPEEKAESTEHAAAGGAGAGTKLFEQAMENGNPNLGAGSGNDAEMSDAERILADSRAFTGAKKTA